MSQCKATARRTGARCQRRAIKGATVCLSHGGAAGQVRRVAAQRVALAEAARLLDQDQDQPVDPLAVLTAAVRSSAALLGAAQEAVKAEDGDADALHQLGEAALLAGRLAKLALDSGVEARLARQAEEAGALVGAMLSRAVNALDLGADTAASVYRLVRAEVAAERLAVGPCGDMSIAELDVEIARVVRALDEHDQADAIAGFPARLAGAVDAALSALDLTDEQQETALAAVETWLARDTAERDERRRTRHERAGIAPSAWWVRPAGNGNGHGGRR